MCPQRFVPESYDAEKLNVLQQAFDAAWKQIASKTSQKDLASDEELRTLLAKAVVDHASTGISDPDELARSAIKSVCNGSRPIA